MFCAANLETGVSFELSAGSIGDYVLGYAEPGRFTLAEAVAASSSFPFAFPPLARAVDVDGFAGGDPKAMASGFRPAARVALTDGGVYDNMGLEPAWKTHATVLVSDGGTPFEDPGATQDLARPAAAALLPGGGEPGPRGPEAWLIAAYLRGVYGGAYWALGTDPDEYRRPGAARPAGYSGRVLDGLRVVRTDLDCFSPAEQSVLMNHGWALAGAALARWGPDLSTQPNPGAPPYPRASGPRRRACRACGEPALPVLRPLSCARPISSVPRRGRQ